MERDCLRLLLRGDGPSILFPARGLPQRLPAQQALAEASGRLLILSGFDGSLRRVTADSPARRNELVAALAEEIWFTHDEPGGEMERISRVLSAFGEDP